MNADPGGRRTTTSTGSPGSPSRRAVLKATAVSAAALGITAVARPARAASSSSAADAGVTGPVRAMIARYLGGTKASQFELQILPGGGPGRFTIGGTPGNVILSGTDGPALTGAFNWWLKYTAGGHVSWNYNQLNLPARLPAPPGPVTVPSPYRIRMYGNPTWDGYTSPYWGWDRWQREIDYFAACSYTHVTVMQGTEMLYYKLLRDYGYSDADARAWIPGPAHQPWWWMDNLSGADGPVSTQLLESRAALAVQIFDRMRELGITPLIPAFIGFVPSDFADRNNGADVVPQGPWSGYTRPALLNPAKAPFADMAADWFGYQKELFGDGFAYSGDFLHEGGRVGDLDLGASAAAIQAAMQKAAPGSLWMLQGWGNSPVKPFVEGLDKSKIWVADLQTDAAPQWNSNSAWWGAPWSWGTISNAGGNVALYGRLPGINTELPAALANPARGDLAGIHFAPEGGDMNPVLADFVADMAWRTQPVDLTSWVRDYADRRYGTASASARSAWQTLLATAYGAQGNTGNVDTAPDSLFNAQPSLDTQSANPYGSTTIPYDPGRLFGVARNLLDAAPVLGAQATFRYDLLDVTRQLHSNATRVLLPQIKAAYQAADQATFRKLSGHWLDLITRLDTLLGTEPSYMLGPWLADAAASAATPADSAAATYDARNILAAWGDRTAWENGLADYSNRDWNGLLGDFYHSRWSAYFSYLDARLSGQSPAAIDWFAFDDAWTRKNNTYPVQPSGDIVSLASSAWSDLAADPMYAQVAVTTSQSDVQPGGSVTVTVKFTNASPVHTASGTTVAVSVPGPLTVTPATITVGDVAPGGTQAGTATVTVPAGMTAGNAIDTLAVTATAKCSFGGSAVTSIGYSQLVVDFPVQPPYKTYSSATDAPATYSQAGQQFSISGAGHPMASASLGAPASSDEYTATYQPGAGGSNFTVVTEVISQQNMTNYWAQAGIIVRNDMTASGSGPEGVTVSWGPNPGFGTNMWWSDNSGPYLDQVMPNTYAIDESLPLWLKLTRAGDVYTSYYSTDGSTWTEITSQTVPGQAATQDVGMFVNSGQPGQPVQAIFNGFTVTSS